MTNNTTTSVLKPCPFCGERGRLRRTFCDDFYGWHYIECSSCEARTDYDRSADDVAVAWNRRAGESNNAQLVLSQIIDRLNESGYECGDTTGVDESNAAAVVDILLQQLDDAVQHAYPAEPAAWIVHARSGDQLTKDSDYVAHAEALGGIHSTPLYTAPPAAAPAVPDGWVMVPRKLTAGNGAKGALSGEFSEHAVISCPECFGDDDCDTCDTCDGSGQINQDVTISWTTIKDIWAAGVEHFSAAQAAENEQ